MKLPIKKFMFFCSCLISCLFSPFTLADTQNSLICTVSDSNDYFKVYPEQLTYSSEIFSHYQLMDGLTVLMVNKNTMQFNRLSNLNLFQNSVMDPNKPPDDYQFFNGFCKYSETQTND
jgi:hypothetical protein